MAYDNDKEYFVPRDGLDSKPIASRLWFYATVALIGGACTVFLSLLVAHASTFVFHGTAAATSLFGVATWNTDLLMHFARLPRRPRAALLNGRSETFIGVPAAQHIRSRRLRPPSPVSGIRFSKGAKDVRWGNMAATLPRLRCLGLRWCRTPVSISATDVSTAPVATSPTEANPLLEAIRERRGSVFLKNTQHAEKLDLQLLEHEVNVLLEILGISGWDISLWLASDDTVQQHNNDFRGKNVSTDILSFPMHELPTPGDVRGLEAELAEQLTTGAMFELPDGEEWEEAFEDEEREVHDHEKEYRPEPEDFTDIVDFPIEATTLDKNLLLDERMQVGDLFRKEDEHEKRYRTEPEDFDDNVGVPIEGTTPDKELLLDESMQLGDLLVSVPYVKRVCAQDARTAAAGGHPEGEDRGVSAAMARVFTVQERLPMLCIHGLLHILGYDHETDLDYEAMVQREEEVLEKFRARQQDA